MLYCFPHILLYSDKKSKGKEKEGKGVAGLTKGPSTAKGRDGEKKSKGKGKESGGKAGKEKNGGEKKGK